MCGLLRMADFLQPAPPLNALAVRIHLGFQERVRRSQADALEFETSPQRPVIEVAAMLSLLDEFACIKNPVVSLKP